MISDTSTASPERTGYILLVEDEAPIVMLMEEIVRDMGCHPLGPAKSLVQALQYLAIERPTAALLDLHLEGTLSYDIAHELDKLGIPYAFTTGHGLDDVSTEFSHVPVVSKPFSVAFLQDILASLLGRNSQVAG